MSYAWPTSNMLSRNSINCTSFSTVYKKVSWAKKYFNIVPIPFTDQVKYNCIASFIIASEIRNIVDSFCTLYYNKAPLLAIRYNHQPVEPIRDYHDQGYL